VNGASFTSGLAPNAIGTVFGTNLSWNTVGVTSSNMSGSVLPTSLGDVGVYFEGWAAYLYYVSPTQINFLVPSVLLPGTFNFWVNRQGVIGPVVQVTLQAAAPAMFEYPWGTAIATHLDNSLVSTDSPAHAGEIVSLWVNGLGNTNPPLQDGALAAGVEWLDPLDAFGIQIDGQAIDPALILYAGVAPGFAGLYQVNVQLPADLPANPQITMSVGEVGSPPGLLLPAQ
jgi:uncharacterized protein (TIGR03437 family)